MKPSLEITTKIAPAGRLPCSNGCGYCPQPVLRLAAVDFPVHERYLTLKQFANVLDKVPADIQIHFSGYTEPFFNPEAPDMIALAKEAQRTVHLYTTLMGLTGTGAMILKGKAIDYVMLHFPDTRQLILPDDLFIAKHLMWRELGIPYEAMAMGPLTHKVAAHCLDLGWPCGVQQIRMNSRAGNSWSEGKLNGPIYCGDDRWHSNVMLPNGDVQLCCMDYGLKTHLGNLFTDPYEKIWQAAEKMKKNTNPPDDSICRRCDYAIPLKY